MKIKKLTEKSTEKLFENLEENFEILSSHYHNHTREFESLSDSFCRIDIGGYEIDQNLFDSNNQMKLETDGNGTFDFENAKIIYNAFVITPNDANDERLWVRLTHDHCHKYIVNRWMKSGKKKKIDTIKERFFFKGRSQSARVRNGISRLWWIAHLTVLIDESDETKKWQYTKAIFESQDFVTSILERSMGTYPNVRMGVLEYYIENKSAFGKAKSKKIQQILRDLNNYGGVNLLPLMSKQEIKDIISTLV